MNGSISAGLGGRNCQLGMIGTNAGHANKDGCSRHRVAMMARQMQHKCGAADFGIKRQVRGKAMVPVLGEAKNSSQIRRIGLVWVKVGSVHWDIWYLELNGRRGILCGWQGQPRTRQSQRKVR